MIKLMEMIKVAGNQLPDAGKYRLHVTGDRGSGTIEETPGASYQLPGKSK